MIHHMANKMTKAEFKEDIVSKLTHIFGVTPEEATYEQYYKAIAIMCKDQLAHEWYDFRHELHRSEDTKTVYYLCMEFLLGRSLKNNLYNMNLTEVAEEALKDFGLTLDMLYECEPDAGLGNGGLGRLAACYLDGLATGGYSSMGYGILYEYGIFKQKIVDGWQTELPDFWLPGGDVWLTAKPDESFNVQFGGNIESSWQDGYYTSHVTDATSVIAVPYDMYISGKDGKGIFPASVTLTADLHSMGQYIQEGERMLMETVISVAKPDHTIVIESDEENLDGLNFLAGKRISEVNRMAELGVQLAHIDGGVPQLRIEIPAITEEALGELIYFFEKACGISGYILGVNPFNQPGVEAYKKNMFALLDKPGYEEESKAIKARL